jgi:hypothetical protein
VPLCLSFPEEIETWAHNRLKSWRFKFCVYLLGLWFFCFLNISLFWLIKNLHIKALPAKSYTTYSKFKSVIIE